MARSPDVHSAGKRLAFAAVTALLTLAVCLALFGLYRRHGRRTAFVSAPYAAMFQKREPPLNYTLLPGWRGVDHGVAVRANAEGVRDDEWPAAPVEGLRVLAVGDSQTFGVSVEPDRAWPGQLQARLDEAGVRATVRAAAVPGWNFEDEAGFIRHHWARLQPHLVAVLVIPNDLDSAITAGPFHQLMAPKQRFEPFYSMTDAWVMESFALARRKDPSLPLTLANAFRESWRVPFFPNFFLENRSESGRRLYRRYEEALGELVRFLRERGSDLLLLVDSRRRAGGFEANVEEIYRRLGVRHVLLSRWAGDYDHYYRNWSNLPRDNHAGPAYHALIADVARAEVAAMPLASAFHLPPPARPLPPAAADGTLAALLGRLRGDRPPSFDPLAPEVTWRRPETLRQLVCMGGAYSQSRFVLESPAESGFLRLAMPPTPPGSAPAAWIEAGGFRGFAPAAAAGGGVLLRLPSPLPRGEPVEVGIVAGAVQGGVFSELFPVEGVALEQVAPESAAWVAADPLLVRANVEGLTEDGWMARELVLPVEMEALARQSAGAVLHVRLESLGPPSVHPIRLTAFVGEVPLAAFPLAGPGPAEWAVPLDRQRLLQAGGRLVLRSDRVFIPAKLDARNPDRRELSVRVTGLSF